MARFVRLSAPFPACLTPAGAVIWLPGNITLDGVSLARHLVTLLNPVGLLFGLNGVILVADVVARQGGALSGRLPFCVPGGALAARRAQSGRRAVAGQAAGLRPGLWYNEGSVTEECTVHDPPPPLSRSPSFPAGRGACAAAPNRARAHPDSGRCAAPACACSPLVAGPGAVPSPAPRR